MLMSKSFYHKITDEQWKIIEPHLPKPKSTGRQGINPRTVFNAIFWMLDSGAKWRYGTVFIIFFASGSTWGFLKKFYSLWSKKAENIFL